MKKTSPLENNCPPQLCTFIDPRSLQMQQVPRCSVLNKRHSPVEKSTRRLLLRCRRAPYVSAVLMAAETIGGVRALKRLEWIPS